MASLPMFVGYTTADAAYAQRIVRALRHMGADVWDGHAPPGVASLDARTKKELWMRPVTIMILSPESLRSVHLASATRIAVEAYQRNPDRVILPVVADPCEADTIWLTLAEFPRVEMAPGLPWPVDEAIARLNAALRLDGSTPPPDAPADDQIRAAVALAWQGRHDAACAALDQARAREPQHLFLPLLQADLLFLAQRYEDVIARCEDRLGATPDDPSWLALKGAALAQCEQHEAALAALTQAAARDPGSLETLLLLAFSHLALKRYAAVLDVTDRMAALDPEFFGVAIYRPSALALLGRFTDALPEARRACALDPDTVARWNSLGVIYRALHCDDEAGRVADRVIAITPCDPAAWNTRAEVYCQQGRYAEALAAFETRQGLLPQTAFSGLQYRILIGLGRRKEAEKLLDDHLKQGGEDTDALLIMGAAAQRAGDDARAYHAYARILEREPEQTHALGGAGMALMHLGKPDHGLALFERALEAEPNAAWLWRNYSWALSQAGRLPDARDAASTAITLDPRDADAWARLAAVLNQERRFTDALEAADHALRRDPANTAALSQKSQALFQMGRAQDAFAADREYARLKPRPAVTAARVARLALILALLAALIIGSYLLAAHLLSVGKLGIWVYPPALFRASRAVWTAPGARGTICDREAGRVAQGGRLEG